MSARHLTAIVGLCCILGLPARSSAQWVTPAGVVTRSVDANGREAQRLSRASVLHTSSVPLSTTLRSATGSRSRNVGTGALVGAIVGGTFGLIVDQTDHTGEGLIAPVMIAGGAGLGALLGAFLGLLVPVHHDPAT